MTRMVKYISGRILTPVGTWHLERGICVFGLSQNLKRLTHTAS
jgi:hypothetical protein